MGKKKKFVASLVLFQMGLMVYIRLILKFIMINIKIKSYVSVYVNV
jgi:hypothetical protein